LPYSPLGTAPLVCEIGMTETCQVDDGASDGVVFLLAERLEHVTSGLLHQLERDRAVMIFQHRRVVVQQRQRVTCTTDTITDFIGCLHDPTNVQH